jgi:hypothetical protein
MFVRLPLYVVLKLLYDVKPTYSHFFGSVKRTREEIGGERYMKKIWRITTLLTLSLFAISIVLSSVSAAPVDKDNAFVCPNLGGKAGLNGNTDGPNFPISELGTTGNYTVGGPHISVPEQATTLGVPPGPHVGPTNPNYTAIWNLDNPFHLPD